MAKTVDFAGVGALEALLEARGNRAKLGVNFAGLGPEDEVAHGVAGDLDVGEGAEHVDLGVGEHDACAGGVLDRELGLAALAGNPPDGARQVVACVLVSVRVCVYVCVCLRVCVRCVCVGRERREEEGEGRGCG